MPIKKSAMKALRQSTKRGAKNKAEKDNLSYLRRMFRKAVESKNKKRAKEFAEKVVKVTDKAVQHNIVKKNTGARIKSRLMKKLNAL